MPAPRKYEIIGKPINGLRHIVRLSDGKLGGLVANNRNLSHFGDCWIHYGTTVTGSARISGNANISDRAHISGSATIYGDATICGHAKIEQYASVSGRAIVRGNAIITDVARINGSAIIDHNSLIGGEVQICGRTKVGHFAKIGGKTHIAGDSVIMCDDDIWTYVTDNDIPMVWTRSNNMLRIGCQYFSVPHWWILTHTGLAKEYPEETQVFRTRFSDQNPDITRNNCG